MTQIHELGPQHVQTQFLDSPSQHSRQSPLDISPRTLSRPRSEATASPYTNFQQAPSITSPFSHSNMSEAMISPQAYHRPSIPYSTPMPRPQPPEQYHETIRPEVRSLLLQQSGGLTCFLACPNAEHTGQRSPCENGAKNLLHIKTKKTKVQRKAHMGYESVGMEQSSS